MTTHTRPLFTADRPRYAVAAHILFWATSALLLCAVLTACAKVFSFGPAGILFLAWVLSGSILGAAAACSGKLYTGDRVFSRKPITGWPARIAGTVALLSTAILLVFSYGLTQIAH
jgi:hypothetical protein